VPQENASCSRRSELEEKKSSREYWRQKVETLETIQRPKAKSDLFGGVNVYFEGYTGETSSYQLRNMVFENGGQVSYHFSSKKVSHVVCTNLCSSKADQFLKKMEKFQPKTRMRTNNKRQKTTPGFFSFSLAIHIFLHFIQMNSLF